MQLITSEDNPRFKAALKLEKSRGRKQQGRILIYGRKEISRAIQGGVNFSETYVCSEILERDRQSELLKNELTHQECPLFDLPSKLFDKLSYGDRSDGFVAVAERPETELDQLQPGKDCLIAIVESVEKPGNLGAVVRSADGAGFDAVIIADQLCDPFHPNSIRASLGTVFTLPVACSDSEQIRKWLADQEIKIFATWVDAATDYCDCDYGGSVAIVVGNESRGLTSNWQSGVTKVCIPMAGNADSLNLSVSAAIVFFEARRQRGCKKAGD